VLDFGDPLILAATAVLLISAFVPLATSRQAQPLANIDRRLTFSVKTEPRWPSLAPPPHDAGTNPRALYPYSIVPGGVRNTRELKTAIANDPVVARHYAEFNADKTRQITLHDDKLVYVSYRIGDEVFWTNHKIRIPRGEALLSDGIHEARTRCGNRLSELPARPVSPKEPPREALEEPPAPEISAIEPPALEFVFTPPAPPPSTAPEPPGHGRIIIPPIIPIWWGAGPPEPPRSPAPPTVPPSVPPVQTPEPDSWLMLVAGFTALLFIRRAA
jgi:hypothetical protein